VKSSNTPEAQTRLCQEIGLQSSKVAVDLTCERHFMQVTAESVQFDPRFPVVPHALLDFSRGVAGEICIR
jgi:hypothetical protein